MNTLVVEDFADFRRFLCTTLQEKTRCVVIGEAANGLEGLKKAEELHPDLVLLDLGLPKMNGMEVARRLPQLSPTSKILMMSQDCSVEIVLEAMRLGVRGYLWKPDVDELSMGVEALVKGSQFVSRRLRHAFPTDQLSANNNGYS